MAFRKKDIKRYYDGRENLSVAEARELFCNADILSSIDEKSQDVSVVFQVNLFLIFRVLDCVHSCC
jgi:hypothetical protein